MCSTLTNIFFSECHHPRSSLPVWCMLSAAVSAGGPVYPGAHRAWHEAWRIQEAQQRSTESLSQPPGQRGWGQGAAAGGQQCITSAKGGRHPRSTPEPLHTWTDTHILPHGHIHTSGTLQAGVPWRGVCVCVHSTKVSSRSLAAPFFSLKQGTVRTLWRPWIRTVLRIFWAAVERCVCVCVWLAELDSNSWFPQGSNSGAYSSPPLLVQNRTEVIWFKSERSICRSQMLLNPCVILHLL